MLKNGWFHNLLLHEERMNDARKTLFGSKDFIELEDILHDALQEYMKGKDEEMLSGKIKCRVLFQDKIQSIEFEPYKMRTLKSLKLVTDDQVEYKYKTTDRAKLMQLFAKREGCDDVIIVKNGLITDCSASNIVFLDSDVWVTPRQPLLKGTKRQLLINLGLVKEMDITPFDMQKFTKARLVNAMIDFEDKLDVDITKIVK